MGNPPMLTRRERWTLAAALGCFGIGATFYLAGRVDGPVGDTIPSFLHTVAIGLPFAVAARRREVAVLAAALLGGLLEVAQATWLPLVGRGTFDRWDLAAVLLGTVVVGLLTTNDASSPTERSPGTVRAGSAPRPAPVIAVVLVAVITSTATGHEPDPDAGIRTVPVTITFEPENVVIEAGGTATVTVVASVEDPTNELSITLLDAPSMVVPSPTRCDAFETVSELRCDFEIATDPLVGVWGIDVLAQGPFDERRDVTGSARLLIETVAPATTTLPDLDDGAAADLDAPEPEITCPPGPAPVGAGTGDAGTAFTVSEVRLDGTGSWSAANGTTALELLGQGGVTVGHVHPEIVWTPCQDGAVDAIRADVTGSATSANDTGAVAVRALVQQGDSVFVSSDAFGLRESDGSGATTWELTEATVTRLAGTEPLDLTSGPTLQVGYTVALSCPEPSICATIERSFDLDSFAAEIVPS